MDRIRGEKYPVPLGFRNLLECLAREVLRAQPTDILQFSAIFFQKLLQMREDSNANPLDNGDLYAEFKQQFLTEVSSKQLISPNAAAWKQYGLSKDGLTLPTHSPLPPSNHHSHSATQEESGFGRGVSPLKSSPDDASMRSGVSPGVESPGEERNDQNLNIITTPTKSILKPPKEKPALDTLSPAEISEKYSPKTPEEVQGMTQAATKIQAAFRGFEVRHKPENFKPLDRKISAQQLREAPITRSLHRSSSHDPSHPSTPDDEAASKIQAGVRGYLTRKHVHKMKEDMDNAATKIQAVFRGYETRKTISTSGRSSARGSGKNSQPTSPLKTPTSTDDSKVDQAATKIQAEIRGFLTRKEIEKEKEAATKIQAAYRGFHVRRDVEDK